MHRLVLAAVQRSGSGCSLMRLKSGHARGVLCAYGPGVRYPAWVAKLADTPDSTAQLRNEHASLEYLARWASTLHVPEVLAWEEDGSNACLIERGAPGATLDPDLPLDATPAQMERLFRAAVRWLESFQATVPVPVPASVGSMVRNLAGAVRQEAAALGASAEALADRLEEFYPLTAPATVRHGDFFVHNILVHGETISVCDWDQFGAGVPHDDFFSLVVNARYCRQGRISTQLEKFNHLFFSDSPASSWLRERTARFPAADARCSFYAFAARQVLPDKGLSRTECRELLEALRRSGYPEPWSGRGLDMNQAA